MKAKVGWLIMAVILLTADGYAADTGDDQITALKSLPVENGAIISIEHDSSPIFKMTDGKEHDNVPPRTVVKLELQPGLGSLIRVEIWLPDAANWNGKFIGLGNGGFAGNIYPGAFIWPLTQGYAVATTDMGTTLGGQKSADESGIDNLNVWRDFGFRATHLMTVNGKLFAEKFYGRPPTLSFFSGASTGGQQALSLAQRYPADYDGILAAVPAHCRTPLHAYFVWNQQVLAKCPFSKEQLETVVTAGLGHFGKREMPGAAGKAISNPRWTSADIDAVIALALQKDPTLTEAHGEAMKKMFDGPRNSTGERIFNGVPPGTFPAYGNDFYYLFRWVFGKNFDPLKFDFDKDMDTYTAALGQYLNAENEDLSEFKKRGGKLLMFSGTADPIVPWHATADYYERVMEKFGATETQEFFRYYLLPARDHGGSNIVNLITPTDNFFQMLVDWREKGEAPDALHCLRVVDGQAEFDLVVTPYTPAPNHDGAERIAKRFRPVQKL